MTVYYKCMRCGSWHKDVVGGTLSKHVHQYYKAGGIIPLSKWERKET